MNPLTYRRLRDHGILMPIRTARAAKKHGVLLSLACALEATEAPWRQRQNILGLELIGRLIHKGNVHTAVKEMRGEAKAIDVLQTMAYFKTLGIN